MGLAHIVVFTICTICAHTTGIHNMHNMCTYMHICAHIVRAYCEYHNTHNMCKTHMCLQVFTICAICAHIVHTCRQVFTICAASSAGMHRCVVCTYAHTYIHTQVHTYLHTYTGIHIHIYIHTHHISRQRVCAYLQTYVYMNSYSWRGMYIWIRIHHIYEFVFIIHMNSYSSYIWIRILASCAGMHIHIYIHTHHISRQRICAYLQTYVHIWIHIPREVCIYEFIYMRRVQECTGVQRRLQVRTSASC